MSKFGGGSFYLSRISLHWQHIVLIIFFTCRLFAVASDIRTICGSYTFYGDPHHSPLECRNQALQGARYNALSRAFGTISTQSVIQHDTNDTGKESSYFDALSITDVKGEWIADIDEPVYENIPTSDGCIAVRCKVKGKARPISNDAVDFFVETLRNGTDPRCVATEFISGDDLYMRIKTPVSGYAAIYLADADHNVFRILPYQQASEGSTPLKQGVDYILFDPNTENAFQIPADELTITASRPEERNHIYVIFSPNRFDKAIDNAKENMLPRSLSYTEFSRWLLRVRSNDQRMGVKNITIKIQDKKLR